MQVKKAKKIMKELNERFKKNIEYISKNSPVFYERVLNVKGKIDVELEIYDDGQLNLIVDGTRLFDIKNPTKSYKDQFNNFTKNPSFIILDSKIEFSEQPKDMQSKYLYKILSFPEDKDFIKKDIQFDIKVVPYLIVFGTGLGYHIQWLIERFDIYNLHIIDLDPELIKPSMYTLNWKKIYEYFKRPGRSLSFTVGVNDAAGVLDDIVNTARNINPGIPIITMFYEHYENDQINIVKESLAGEYDSIIKGPWTFDLIFEGIQYSTKNIENGIPAYYADLKVKEEIPAFLIAAGPSLDDTVTFIKEHQDKAVIIAVGAVLKKLKQEGIKPDFVIEVEDKKDNVYYRHQFQYDTDYYKDLFMMFIHHAYPEVFNLSGKSGMYINGGHLSMNLFKNIPVFNFFGLGSTVSEAALVFALSLGFKSIYLFGLDLGYKDPQKHHATGTIHYDKDFKFYKQTFANYIKVKGNLRDFVFTERFFSMSKIAIQNIIRTQKPEDTKIYNTSDGVYIEGTIPFKPVELEFLHFSQDIKKQDLIVRIEKNFRKDYQKDINMIKSNLQELKEDILDDIKRLKDVHTKISTIKSYENLIEVMYDINKEMISCKYPGLFMGSLWRYYMYLHLGYLKVSKELRHMFVEHFSGILTEFFDEAENMVKDLDIKTD